MKRTNSVSFICACALILSSLSLIPTTTQASVILQGSDYFETIAPTFFNLVGPLKGLPIGPGSTDTIVQRKDACNLDLNTAGSNCTIDIEMIALSLQSIADPMLLIRESLTLASVGNMTMASDGTGTGGMFDSTFSAIFIELSLDGGATYNPFNESLSLFSVGTEWTTIEPPAPFLFVDGPVGDQAANRHSGKSADQFDFYVDEVVEEHPGAAVHTARGAIPEPGTTVLFGVGLGLLALLRRRTPGHTLGR